MGYVDIIEKLSKALKPVSEGQDATAAVAILLKPVDQDIKILFVKRAESPTDPWSGQMAFPGGKRDAKDQNLKQTVVRETLEETNINLLDGASFLGVMEALSPGRRLEMKILPFVVLLDYEPTIRLNENELMSFVWISLEKLAQLQSSVEFSFGKFPAYIIGDNVIWGLTYRIVKKVVQALESN